MNQNEMNITKNRSKRNKRIALLIEGPDNVGKGTQIELIKKKILQNHILLNLHYSGIKSDKDMDLELLSRATYANFMETINFQLSRGSSLIADRSHIGEAVYSPMYRDYNGDYVFGYEKLIKANLEDFIYLVTFIDKPRYLISRDDGLSFSVSIENKRKEIDLFKRAHEKTNIKNKLLINIHGKSIEQVFEEVRNFTCKE